MTRMNFALLATLALATPGRCEQQFNFSKLNLPLQKTLSKQISAVDGSNITFSLANGLLYNDPDWKRPAMMLSGVGSSPVSEAVFDTKSFPVANFRSVLTIWEGQFTKDTPNMSFSVSCGYSKIAVFSARQGGLYISKPQQPDVKFGTYKLSGVVNGQQKAFIHSAIVLVDTKKRTYRITFMQDGEWFSTGILPIGDPQADLAGKKVCSLHITFDEPSLYARYYLSNVGISAN